LQEFLRVGADESMLADRDWLEQALEPFRDRGLLASVVPDEEHNLFKIIPGANTNGTRWIRPIGRDFMAAPEYRTLLDLYKDVEPFDSPPLIVMDSATDESTPERRELDSREALLDFLLSAGKKGLHIQRYKGLGEMNPQQLWDTTMDPEIRVLLTVKIDDEVDADEIFTVLMGDAVEPRRNFIEENALEVSNLDI
jgi:DNA gyrase subunit B